MFNRLDTKLEITEYEGHSITRSELQKYVIINYFDYRDMMYSCQIEAV